MKKPCKECPHFVRNRHNDMIVDFAERMGKKTKRILGLIFKIQYLYIKIKL